MAGSIMDRIRALMAQQQGGPMPNSPPPPVGMPGMMGPAQPPQPMDTMGNPALAAGMAQGAMGGPPPMGPGLPNMMPPTAPGQPGGMPFAPPQPVGMPGMMPGPVRQPPSAMDGSVMSGRDHLDMLSSADPDQDETPGLGMGDLLGIGRADAAEVGQGMAAGRDLLNTPRATGATPLPQPKAHRPPIPTSAIRPRVPVPSSRPDIMPHSAPGYGFASGYDPSTPYASSVTPQSRVSGNGGPPRALFPMMGGGMAHGGTTGGGMAHGGGTGGTAGQAPAAGGFGQQHYLMDYIARMMGRG